MNVVNARILHITNAGGFGRIQRGGGERAVEELSSAFSNVPGWSAAVAGPCAFLDVAALGSNVGRYGLDLDDFKLSHALTPRGRIANILREFQPTVVICHLLRGTIVGAPAARMFSNARVVSILHNSLTDSADNSGLSDRKNSLNKLAFRSISGLVDVHVAISPSNARDLATHDRVPLSKIRTINNWVSNKFTDDINKSVAGGVNQKKFELLFVGRLEAQKNPAFLLNILQKLPEDAALSYVGVGSLEADLKVAAVDYGLSDRVSFLGQRTDIPELMAAADIVLVPSLFEGFGRVALEAVAVGTPVMASDVAGLRDVLGPLDSRVSMLLGKADEDAWIDAIRCLYDEPCTNGEAANLKKFARSKYSFESSFQDYTKLVADMTDRGQHAVSD